MHRDNEHNPDLDATNLEFNDDPSAMEPDEENHQPSSEERRALLEELRAQIASGTYKPSIGRISVSIFGELAAK